MSTVKSAIFARTALLKDGFASAVRLETGEDGSICTLQTNTIARPGDMTADIIIPGMPNLHSHAFQRAMAGLAETSCGTSDTFWTWRHLMYDLANKISPDDLAAIATQAYLELLKFGYTSVAEFHYLHGLGDPSSPLNVEMSEAIFSAATQTGIGLTHLPVLYEIAGFGETEPAPEQKAFCHTPDDFIRLVETLTARAANYPNIDIGIAFHSLRAVRNKSLIDISKWAKQTLPGSPVHIHIAEQEQEVADCLERLGARPVEWLQGNVDVDETWCLVHATHMSDNEITAAAKTGSVAGLCPTTEANLGDGFFELTRWNEYGGAIGIGSDSNVCLSPVEELRLLEYGHRLRERRRLVATSPEHPGTGAFLWSAAAQGGAQALGRKAGALAIGNRADFLTLDAAHPALCTAANDGILNALIFGPSQGAIQDVYVNGVRVIHEGHHAREAEITARYTSCVTNLLTQ